MKRLLSTLLASAVFLAMLTGTKKRGKPREAGSIPKLSIPATTGWARTEVAGIRFFAPPNSVVERAEQPGGVRIKLASGYVLTFNAEPHDISKNPQHDFHMYYAPDAQIVLHEMGAGDECQAIACTTVPIKTGPAPATVGPPLCVNAMPRNNDECAQIVAIVRSIESP